MTLRYRIEDEIRWWIFRWQRGCGLRHRYGIWQKDYRRVWVADQPVPSGSWHRYCLRCGHIQVKER